MYERERERDTEMAVVERRPFIDFTSVRMSQFPVYGKRNKNVI